MPCCSPLVNEPDAQGQNNIYLQAARALLDSLREIVAEKVLEMLPKIDELLKTHSKLTNELRFLLDVRDYEISTLRDLVAVESF